MRISARNVLLAVGALLLLTGVCFGKEVYLSDGGIIECESFWRRGDLIIVKINRDTVVEFGLNEVDQRRTHLAGDRKARPVRKKAPRAVSPQPAAASVASPAAVKPHVAVAERPVMATPAPSVKLQPAPTAKPQPSPAAKPQPAASPVPAAKLQPAPPSAAAKPQPAPAPAPVVATAEKATPQAVTAPTSPAASPLSKEDLDEKRRQAAEMMAEAIKKNDRDMMKNALELQKSTVQQNDATQSKGIGVTMLLVILAVCLLIVVSQWVVFEKAGESGWKCLVPIYNMYILMLVSGKPGWWFLLLFVPLAGMVFYLLAMLSLAERFGKGALFGIGLTFLPFIFFPLLAFGGAQAEF